MAALCGEQTNPAAAASAGAHMLTFSCCYAAGNNRHKAQRLLQVHQRACSLLLYCSSTRTPWSHCCQGYRVSSLEVTAADPV
jgi:hypothetical protein